MSDWKELNIDNLIERFFTRMDIEIEILQGYGWEGAQAEINLDFRTKAIDDIRTKKTYRVDEDISDNVKLVKYRYRLKPLEPMKIIKELNDYLFNNCCGGVFNNGIAQKLYNREVEIID